MEANFKPQVKSNRRFGWGKSRTAMYAKQQQSYLSIAVSSVSEKSNKADTAVGSKFRHEPHNALPEHKRKSDAMTLSKSEVDDEDEEDASLARRLPRNPSFLMVLYLARFPQTRRSRCGSQFSLHQQR